MDKLSPGLEMGCFKKNIEILFFKYYTIIMNTDKISKELKQLLINNFGKIIDNVILYGSQLSGNSEEYSDYDYLIILKTDYDWKLKKRIQDVCWEIDYKYDIVTDIKIISVNELNTIKGKQLYIQSAIQEGVYA